LKVLLLVLDTVRRDFLSAYGNDWVKTPNLSRLAQKSVVFDNHWVGSLPCMPARREFMTGRHNFLDRGWGPVEPFDDVLPVELRKNKVFSHLITDHYHYFELGSENYHTAFDTWDFYRGQENDPWVSLVDRPALPEHLGIGSPQNTANRTRQIREEDFSAAKTAQAAVQWLKDNKGADNWFLQVEIFDPHEPFHCVDKYREMYGDDYKGPHFDWPFYKNVSEPPEAVEHIRKRYAGLLTMTDHWVGKIFDQMDAQNLWEDTLVIFTTDHGTMLGEHQTWMKSHQPVYNEIAHIPLMAHLPGSKHAGRRVAAMTQTFDIMPTILDYMNCPLPPHVQGKSLRPVFDGGELRSDGIFGYFGMATNITDGKHVYFRNPVNEDAGPLHSYTSIPIQGMKKWYSRDRHESMEMGRFFDHTYNLPLYKIPTAGQPPRPAPGQPSFVGRHELFDIVADPKQLHPLNNPQLEADFVRRLKKRLKACQAPVEQYTRLGLQPE
jgi:arylsulfatase A-like enzyme